MATAKGYGRLIAPGGQRHLNRAFGTPQGLEQLFMVCDSKDNIFFHEEFFELRAGIWTTAATGTATTFAIPGTVLVDGTLQGATGTTTQAGISLRGPLGFSGTVNAGLEMRFKLSAVTAFCMEFGFLDAITTATGAAFSSIDTPAVNAGVGDCAVIGVRTSDTASGFNLCTRGSGGGQSAAALAMGTAATVFPAAATYMTLRLQLVNESGANTTSVVATVDDKPGQQYTQSLAAAQIVAGTVLRPWIYFGDTAAGSARTVDIDYIRWWADRI
jgi:hypothetical protein